VSSHHIIRENQEPALLILDWIPSHQTIIEQLLEWSPMVILSYGVLTTLTHVHFKVDAVLLPADKTPEDAAHYLPQASVVLLPVHDSEISTAFTYLRQKRQSNVSIFSVHDDRMHQLNDSSIHTILYTPVARWMYRHNLKFRKWLPQNSRLIFYPSGITFSQVVNLTPEGFVKQDGQVILQSATPFWLGEPFDQVANTAFNPYSNP
jgi:thiamine pyrophosphokinase